MRYRMTRLDRVKNEYIRGSLGITNIVWKIRKIDWNGLNILRETNNYEIVKKNNKIKIEGNWGRRDKLEKK